MKHMCPSLLLFVFPACLLAQPDTLHLEDVTISVTPFEQRLSRATGSLSILTPLQGEESSTISLAGLLNTAPGVFMACGSYTTNRITIRGIGSRSPYSSNRIRAYLDEIPLTNGDGITTLEDIDLAGISRIEVLKGPSSAMYGSGLGGVVKLRSSLPERKGISGSIAASAGTFNTWKSGAKFGWKDDKINLSAGYTRATSDGFRENNSFRRNQLFFSAETVSQKNQFTVHMVATDLYSGIPSSLNEEDFNLNPSLASPNWLAVKGYESSGKISSGASWKHRINRHWENQLVLFGGWNDPYESRPFNILDDQSVTAGARGLVKYGNDRFRMQAGAEIFRENYRWQIFETISGEAGEEQLHNNEIRRYGNLFAHFTWIPVQRLSVEGGLNGHLLEYRLATIYSIDNMDQSGNYAYSPLLSPRIGINYKLAGTHFIHFTTGHGFSAPSLEETLLPEGLVNPDLRPETGWNIDAGLRGWNFENRWYYDLTAYTIFARNILVTKRITEDTFTGINAGAARLSGIELYNRISLTPPSSVLKWNHTVEVSSFLSTNRFTEFIDDGSDFSGKELPGIPSAMIFSRLSSDYKKVFHFHLECSYSGRQWMNDANTESYPGHLLVNAETSVMPGYEILPFRLRISAGVNNLFDAHYASMILVNAPSFGGALPRYYYPGLPRNIFFSLRLEI